MIYRGSFSKSIAPTLRVGYIVADWDVISRLLSIKTDGGTGAIEQMMLAEFARRTDAHLDALNIRLRAKDAICRLWRGVGRRLSSMRRRAGSSSGSPAGAGRYIRLAQVAREGDDQSGRRMGGKLRNRASPGGSVSRTPREAIRDGVAKLAEICQREFGVPVRSANVER